MHIRLNLMDCHSKGTQELEAACADAILSQFGSVEAAAAAKLTHDACFRVYESHPCGDPEADAIMSRWADAEGQAIKTALVELGWLGIDESAYIAVTFLDGEGSKVVEVL